MSVVVIHDARQIVLANETVITDGSYVTGSAVRFGAKETNLFVNIKSAPTGTSPSITFTLQEVDPGDLLTPVGPLETGVPLVGVGIQVISLPVSRSGTFRVTWVVGGVAPSFTGVYATIVSKLAGTTTLFDTSGNPVAGSAGSPGDAVLSVQGVPGGTGLAAIEPPDQQAGLGLSLIVDPSTVAQSANYTNSTAPANAVLSNTTAGYTTLGGLFQFEAPTGAETDYALFAFQVPVGYSLYVDSVRIEALITGNKSSTSETVLQWALAANSSAVSLATGGPNPPIRFPVGIQQAPKSSSRGETFAPGPVIYEPRTPVVISPTLFFHVILRVPVGNATPNQIIRGFVNVEGYFQS